MVTLYINDLIIEAKHGWHDHEKKQAQRFKISLELVVSDHAATTDSIDETLNWSDVRDTIVRITQGNSFNLVERLAQEIANQLLEDKRVRSTVVAIDKLDAFPSGVPGVRLEASN